MKSLHSRENGRPATEKHHCPLKTLVTWYLPHDVTFEENMHAVHDTFYSRSTAISVLPVRYDNADFTKRKL